MIARPNISRNERNAAEIGAFEVGNFALFSRPVRRDADELALALLVRVLLGDRAPLRVEPHDQRLGRRRGRALDDRGVEVEELHAALGRRVVLEVVHPEPPLLGPQPHGLAEAPQVPLEHEAAAHLRLRGPRLRELQRPAVPREELRERVVGVDHAAAHVLLERVRQPIQLVDELLGRVLEDDGDGVAERAELEPARPGEHRVHGRLDAALDAREVLGPEAREERDVRADVVEAVRLLGDDAEELAEEAEALVLRRELLDGPAEGAEVMFQFPRARFCAHR